MKVKFRQRVIKFIVIPFMVVGLISAIQIALFWWNFMSISNIEIERFDDFPYHLNIPVRYVDRHLTNLQGHSIYTANHYRYSLRIDDNNNVMWITICRWSMGGFVVNTARYEITDPSVKKKLLELHHDSLSRTE